MRGLRVSREQYQNTIRDQPTGWRSEASTQIRKDKRLESMNAKRTNMLKAITSNDPNQVNMETQGNNTHQNVDDYVVEEEINPMPPDRVLYHLEVLTQCEYDSPESFKSLVVLRQACSQEAAPFNTIVASGNLHIFKKILQRK